MPPLALLDSRAPLQGHHTWACPYHLLQGLHHLHAPRPSWPGGEENIALFSSFVRNKCHQALCEDMDGRLILPRRTLVVSTGLLMSLVTAGFRRPECPSSPTGHHHQDAAAEGCANQLGGDSMYTTAVFCSDITNGLLPSLS